MEHQKHLVRDFSQLRLPAAAAHPASWPRPALPRPSVDLPRPAADWPHRSLRRGIVMDALVQDFNTALDETAGSNSSGRSAGRRKAWKRRCKSTSNLLQIGQNLSEDSSSSLDNVALLSRDRGTSSLQLSDSDLEAGQASSQGRRNRLGRIQDHRKKGRLDGFGIESDSFTENISPFKEFRVNSKRKRKSKRMVVEHENIKPNQQSFVFRSPGQGTKRKKIKSRSEGTVQGKKAGVLPGKRKRSAREKSAESREKEMEKMETEETRSSSSLSSSEWEDLGSDLSLGDNDGREADDEQSDWPGPEPGLSVMQLTDEELDPDITFSVPRLSTLTRGRSFSSREIKAGTRRLRGQKSTAAAGGETGGGTVPRILSHAETISKFIQDTSVQSVRLTLSRPSDRNIVLSLASLHTLSWTQDGETSIYLSKNVHLSGGSEFAVPGIPRSREKKKFEPKRQKKAPPLSPVLTGSRLDPDPRMEEEGAARSQHQPEGIVTRQRVKSGSKSS